MKRILIVCSLFALCAGFTFAQSGMNVSGRVLDSGNSPLAYATVALYSQADSVLSKVEYSSDEGAFQLNSLAVGKYFLEVSYVGYSPMVKGDIELAGESIDLGDLVFENSSADLAEVVVATTRPLIEIQADKTVFNVGASVTASGTDALELLRRAPGVMLDQNDNIQIRGKSGVIIQIDGRTTHLSQEELANLLRGLNSDDIERIEVITNPSARYEASGNSGIINIVMKKQRGMGSNGTVSLSGSVGRQYSASSTLNFNHRSQHLNFYGNLSLANRRHENGLSLYRRQNERLFDQDQREVVKSWPVNSRVGVDYFIDDRHTAGLLLSGGTHIGDWVWDSRSKTYISPLSSPEMIDSVLVSNTENIGKRRNAAVNFNYSFKDKQGQREVTVDLDRAWFSNRTSAYQPNHYFNADETEKLSESNFRTKSPSQVDIISGKVDFEQKLNGGLSLSAGIQYTEVTTDNEFEFFKIDQQDEDIRDPERSNHFIYDEKVSAAYLSANGRLSPVLSFQAGLRLERTKSTGDLRRDAGQPEQPDDLVERSYTDLFPSGSVTWQVSEMHALSLSYSRRINRPNYRELNPFEWRIDELSFRKGNPFLRPYYANSFEVRYMAFQLASISAGYTRTTDLITDIVEPSMEEPDRTFINYRNLSTQDHYFVGISSPTPIKSWWNGFVNVNIFKTRYIADFEEYDFDVSTPVAVNFYAEQNFSLSPGSVIELSGWYNSSAIWGGGWVTDPHGALNVGFQHRFMENRATVKMTFSDVLNTAKWSSTGEAVPGMAVDASGYWDSRQFRVNLSYRFGDQEVRSNRQRRTGIDDEKGRVGE